ncbi:ArnT family glycosyltransferase [Lacisediminihabitans changchengi]|uniref:Glycosyltransferase family 39 protein n=1 Tax=Lacisediminihabitans changchengi TaxID=2787634 RepID=A0A934SI03_9MICO|nr:glycosyltransferase family 39 protein [Lacisediminihabitans changchengi]MBK4347017.1 glycosyltransferase family 39 protein [Lacisediminihabitans changchengi]MBK4347860.1 glycosyltransferase family 39 protein [Lacisediminihabitans changchengi]
MTSTTHDGSTVVQLTDAASRASVRIKLAALRHRLTLLWLSPTLVLAGIATFLNFGGSPQRIDDEGTYTAQAYAVSHFGELAHYTYWYDHPPLGWLQIAGYTQLTGAFARYSTAVLAGREAVIVFSLISVVLLWVLARRVGLTRAAAAAAGVIFAVSPLAVQFHRSVYLDNVATPWLIAAFVLALSKRNQLAGFAASAACFSVAVLSKETFLLALPFLIWAMVRSSRAQTRRYTLSVAGTVLVLIGFSYVLLALVKGELLPGAGRVSLFDGVTFQLGTRASSGSVFDPASLISRTFAIWTQLDPVFIVFGILAAIAGVFARRLRVFAVMTLALVAFMFRPGGYLPVPYVIMLLPFGALLIAGVTDSAVRAIRRRAAGRWRAIVWATAATLALAVAVPVWTVQLRGLFLADLDSPMRSAEQWVETNVAHDQRLIVDDSMWVDLERAGWARDNVVWYYKIDTDPAVEAQSPQGWKDSDYIVATNSMRTGAGTSAEVTEAIANSTVVASFGQAEQAVQVRRIEPEGMAAAKTDAAAAQQSRAETGTQLAQNPALGTSVANKRLLTAGRVDDRITLALGSATAISSITVQNFPAVAGETGPLRQVLITAFGSRTAVSDGRLTSAAKSFVTGLTGTFVPQSARGTGGGLLLTYGSR